jgi:hypothetical protein
VVTVPRRGVSRLGCLVVLVLLAALGYFAVNVGDVYVRYFRYQDAMRQEARFAARRSDDLIRLRLQSTADSLGLPEAAGNVQIRRTRGHLEIWAEYYEHVELPLFVREIYFNPTAQRTF